MARIKMKMQIKYFGTVITKQLYLQKLKVNRNRKSLLCLEKDLEVMVSNDIEPNHFDKACNGSLIKAFINCGFDIDKIIFETNDNDQEHTSPQVSTYSRRRRTKCT